MRWLLAFFVVFTAAPAFAFEGEVDAKSIGDAATQHVKFKVFVSEKGDVRMDTSTKDRRGKKRQTSYIKPAKGKYDYMLDHGEKRAMKIQKDTFNQATASAHKEGKGKRANVSVKKLGTATVAGQPTRHVQVIDEDDGDTADLWLSDRYPVQLWQTIFSFGGDQANSPTSEWTRIAEREYGFKPGFIMKMLSKGKSGKSSGLEVTRIEKGKVAANTFAIPSGYEVVTMPNLGGASNMKMPTTREEAEKMRDEMMKEMQQQQR